MLIIKRLLGILLLCIVWVGAVAVSSFDPNPSVGCTENTGGRELRSIARELSERTGAQSAQLVSETDADCSSGGDRPAIIGYSGTTKDEVSGRLGSVTGCRRAADGRFECRLEGLSVTVVLSAQANGDTDATVSLQ